MKSLIIQKNKVYFKVLIPKDVKSISDNVSSLFKNPILGKGFDVKSLPDFRRIYNWNKPYTGLKPAVECWR